MDAVEIAKSLNFSWLIEGQVAGSAAPMSKAELEYLRLQGIGAIIRLAHPKHDDYVMDHLAVTEAGLEDLQLPVEDFHAPSLEQIDAALRFIHEQVQMGRAVAVSCGACCGRTGSILACYLVSRGYTAQEALLFVISKRPCSNEIESTTPAQKKAIYDYERWIKASVVR